MKKPKLQISSDLLIATGQCLATLPGYQVSIFPVKVLDNPDYKYHAVVHTKNKTIDLYLKL